MRVIARGRQSGKTTNLIHRAAADFLYIVTVNHREAERVHRQAMDMGVDIPQPITFDEFMSGRFHASGVKGFVIDNVDVLLESIAGSVPVVAFAATTGESQ